MWLKTGSPGAFRIKIVRKTLPRGVAIIGDHVRLFQTFAGHKKDSQRHEIKAKLALFLVVDRQLHIAALWAFFSCVSDKNREVD